MVVVLQAAKELCVDEPMAAPGGLITGSFGASGISGSVGVL